MSDNEDKIKSDDVVYEKEEDSEEPTRKIEKLKKRLKDCHEGKEKYLAGWQRAQADFINYRRRQEEQAAEWSAVYGGGLIYDVLPALDSLDAAMAAHPENEGLANLSRQFRDILKKHGLEEIKALGEKFNPQLHEVVECEGCLPDEKSEGEIVSGEVQKG